MKALILFSHGSRRRESNEEMARLPSMPEILKDKERIDVELFCMGLIMERCPPQKRYA